MNNTIGFGAANGTGTTTISGSSNEFRGIALTALNTTTFSSIQGNIISGINQTTSRSSAASADASAFIGIQSGSSTLDAPANIGNVEGNTIGSLDGSSTIVINATTTTASVYPVMGILDYNFEDALSVSNNNIGSITINSGGSGTTTGFRGIYVASTNGVTHTVSNNTIGGSVPAGAITNNIVGNYAMYGIHVASANGNVTGNTVRNMAGNVNASGFIISSGILAQNSTGVNTISQNTVHSLSNNSGAANNSIYAIYCSFASGPANIVERNFVHSLSITSSVTTGQLAGILPIGGSGTYKNNMISWVSMQPVLR